MKDMRFSVIGMCLMVLASGAFAQGKYGASPEDSLTCVQNLSVYSEYYKQKAYDNAIPAWKKAMVVCPKSSKNMYVRGVTMYQKRIVKEKDPARKRELLDTLYWIYDRRIEFFGEEAKVKGRKGGDILRFDKENLVDAYKTLGESVELAKEKTDAAVLVAYYKSMYKMYKKGKVKKEALVEMYPTLMDYVDANRNGKKAAKYKKAEENLQKMFAPVADCPDLIGLFTPKFEATPDDVKLLKNVLKLMDAKECTDADLYIKVAVRLNELEPSATSAYSIGNWYLKKVKYKEAVGYFLQAAELAEDDAKKEESYLRAAAAYLGSRDYPNVRGAARKVLSVNPNNGEAYILIGDAYSGSSKNCGENDCEKRAGYWAAFDMYAKAKAVDSNVADKAGKKMGQVKAQFPKKADCFFQGFNEGDAYNVGCWIGEATKVRVNE